jgi:hypothetical protein
MAEKRKPNVLIYEPVGKKLKLVAAEWLVPLTPDTKERPSLFGHPFMGPMEGHEPLIQKDYVHYDLHVWLFKNKPFGMFAPTKPDVNCKGSSFSPAGKADQDDAGANVGEVREVIDAEDSIPGSPSHHVSGSGPTDLA